MDVTALFKACVKTVKIRNKAMGIDLPSDGERNKIFAAKPKNEFALKSYEIVAFVSKLRDFLQQNRKDYMNNDLLVSFSGMNDNERDQIDTETQNVIKRCSKKISEFREEVSRTENVNPQLLEHKMTVLRLMDDYLKSVCKIYSEQKAVRVKRKLDMQKFSKLESTSQSRKRHSEPIKGHDNLHLTEKSSSSKQDNASRTSQDSTLTANDIALEEFSSEEIQMFEQENKRLFEEFHSLASDIRQIEGKVIGISRLQEIFAEKVLEQEKDIDHVASTVIGTTENIKDANEEIREAMKKNASFRVWILFFLLVLSFTLLFLDWYNP